MAVGARRDAPSFPARRAYGCGSVGTTPQLITGTALSLIFLLFQVQAAPYKASLTTTSRVPAPSLASLFLCCIAFVCRPDRPDVQQQR